MTRKIAALVIPVSRPRNPLVVATLTRRAGAHGNTGKAKRQQMRQRVQNALPALLAGDLAEFELD
ncbi:MAG: hypothetical protein LBE62_15345 [Azonexus sp.]|jgi:hypothetical protein|nr:hypothetical protein [Azonexus sp.]